jgi:hypothetical protein
LNNNVLDISMIVAFVESLTANIAPHSNRFDIEMEVQMLTSITKSAALLLLAGSALLVGGCAGTHDARAEMSAQEKHEQALSQCENAMRGQRSFCIEEANAQYRRDSAKEQKKDVTAHHDYDTSNDTPAQTQAKQAYQQATDKCMDVSKGQRSFCMEEAHSKYRKGMSW